MTRLLIDQGSGPTNNNHKYFEVNLLYCLSVLIVSVLFCLLKNYYSSPT